ncbi:uncharacterized protein LOC114755818 [Neltuma alba]|uniref:uncharacterized protein LOC114755818 n=1 Tax=Neltuma alba TaxID=207710 RepID=UPI0010A45586|nr:uncharacterized protein LOC114755818 [Prosopis alba]
MAESYETVNPKPNGAYVEVAAEKDVDGTFPATKGGYAKERETLYEILHHMVSAILVADQGNNRAPLLHRIKTSVSQYASRIPEASRNTSQDVLLWTRQGSPLRALLVVSVGTITLVSLTGLFVFLLLVLAATFNAIVISLFVSLAVAGGFLALFFASVTAIYIGALSIAIFAICTASFWAIVAILVTTGWVGFFCTLWLATRKGFELAKQFLTVTSSAITNYADARHPLKIENLDSD